MTDRRPPGSTTSAENRASPPAALRQSLRCSAVFSHAGGYLALAALGGRSSGGAVHRRLRVLALGRLPGRSRPRPAASRRSSAAQGRRLRGAATTMAREQGGPALVIADPPALSLKSRLGQSSPPPASPIASSPAVARRRVAVGTGAAPVPLGSARTAIDAAQLHARRSRRHPSPGEAPGPAAA